MDDVDGTLEVLRHLAQQLDPRHGEPGAVTTIGHRHELDGVVLRELRVLLRHGLVALRARDAGVVLDLLAVDDGDVCHGWFLLFLGGQVPAIVARKLPGVQGFVGLLLPSAIRVSSLGQREEQLALA